MSTVNESLPAKFAKRLSKHPETSRWNLLVVLFRVSWIFHAFLLHTQQVHSTLHTGEKPNICGLCGKAFRVRANYFKHRKIHMRAANSAQRETEATGEAAPEEHEDEDEGEEEEDGGGQGEVEGDTGITVGEAVVHHNLVPVTASAGDFFPFTNEQQWIT